MALRRTKSIAGERSGPPVASPVGHFRPQSESVGPIGSCMSRGTDFTHPWAGQAEHLACRERSPNAFLRAEARAHFAVTPRANSIDNFLITVAGTTGYPQKYLVWCASQRWGHAIPDFYGGNIHGSEDKWPGGSLPGDQVRVAAD